MEANVEGVVIVRAERDGWYVRKVSWVNSRGAPDRLFIKGGRTVWIEFKDRNKEPGLLQVEEHKALRAAGAEIHVCDRIRDGLKILGIK